MLWTLIQKWKNRRREKLYIRHYSKWINFQYKLQNTTLRDGGCLHQCLGIRVGYTYNTATHSFQTEEERLEWLETLR